MEAAQPQQGLKGILLSALGLQHDVPAGPAAQIVVAAPAAVEAADAPVPDGAQATFHQEPDQGADVAAHGAPPDDTDGVFASRLASITQQVRGECCLVKLRCWATLCRVQLSPH